MPQTETFEGYKHIILNHWDTTVENVTDKPKDMDTDRRQCDNYMCKFIESNDSSLKNHKNYCDKRTIKERKEKNIKYQEDNEKERAMYFIKTNHPVLPENRYKQRNDASYAVYKVGKTDDTLEKRVGTYQSNKSLKRVIRTKKFIGIGVFNVEDELLDELRKNPNLIQRTDITADKKCDKNAQKNNISSPDESNEMDYEMTPLIKEFMGGLYKLCISAKKYQKNKLK